jgi:hypothetical protein
MHWKILVYTQQVHTVSSYMFQRYMGAIIRESIMMASVVYLHSSAGKFDFTSTFSHYARYTQYYNKFRNLYGLRRPKSFTVDILAQSYI